jgi:hypothetical protein
MINWFGSAQQVGASLSPASYAAGANNGAWVDVRAVKGELFVPIHVGAVTGSVVFKLQDATDGSGTGAADLSPAVATASINTANSTAKLVVDGRVIRSHVRVVATVTTGPVFAAASVCSIPPIVG